MSTDTTRYRAAAARSVEFQLGYQQPDGGYIWEGYAPDAFHKQAYAWGVNGRVAEAQRLIEWIRRERLGAHGEVKGYGSDLYKYAWMVQGAHRLGRFDVSRPVFQAALRHRLACGAFPLRPAAGAPCRSLSTCWLGVAAVYLGDLDTARATLAWAEKVFEDQPDPGRFYYQTTPEGELLVGDDAVYVDNGQPQQCYWEISLPIQLACRLHMATGESRHLDLATALFERHARCHDDAYRSTSSGKSGLAAALLYAITGSSAAREKATQFGDYLLATQLPEGGWHNPSWPDEILYKIDAASEFSVWLSEIAALLDCR